MNNDNQNELKVIWSGRESLTRDYEQKPRIEATLRHLKRGHPYKRDNDEERPHLPRMSENE